MNEALMEELIPFVDDRISCDDCQNFKVKKWGGKCGAGEVFYVGLKHRCAKSVVFLQHYQKPTETLVIKKTSNIWDETQKPFWE